VSFLKENHRLYYTVYRAMLELEARLERVLEMIMARRSKETIIIESIDIETERLACFEDEEFCRYYLGLKGHQKLFPP